MLFYRKLFFGQRFISSQMGCCVVGCVFLDSSKDDNGSTVNCLTVKVEVLRSFQPKTQQCSPQEMHLKQCHCSSSNLTPCGCFLSDIQILDTSMCNNFLYNVTYAASYQMGALPAPVMCAIILPASVLHFTNHSNNSVLMHASAPAIATLSNVLIW